MRFRNLKKWDDPRNCPGLLYLAQILEEMLFDFSLDTYKPSVMHTGLLCNEALQTIREIKRGNIRQPNINHVAAELCNCYESDTVAKALIILPPTSFTPTLKNTKSTLQEIQTVLELLSVQLSLKNYRNKNEELLRQEILGDQSISEIRKLARNYVTTLIAIGFNQKFLHDKCLEFFYYGSNRIAGVDAINDFFDQFTKENHKYKVFFRVKKIFENASTAFSPIGLTVTSTIPEEIDLNKYPEFKPNKGDTVYAIVNDVEAKDEYSARTKAEGILKLSSTLLTIYHHKEIPEWQQECIVFNLDQNNMKKIQKPINAMHKCKDLMQATASKKLNLFLSEFSLKTDSFLKFIRSAQLHAMALGSNSSENQILNLWISLESLIPSEAKSDSTANIEHIVNSLIPFLSIGYFDRLINNLVKDLLRWNSFATKQAFRNISGIKFTDKLLKLLILPENATHLAKLESSFGEFHLLRDRVEYFKNILSCPKNVLNALDIHRTRLEWQIRRIYRTRNIIVHSGKTPSYTNSLIQHTHDYLDTVLSLLVKLATKPKVIDSVSQGFKYLDLQYTFYCKSLSKKDLSFNASNISELIFTKI